MIQCQDCEHFMRGPGGEISFKCDPFSNIKEPECVVKWQLLRMTELGQKMERMVGAYEATLDIYKRMQPLQEKLFRHMENEIEEMEEGEAWKHGDGEDDDEHDEDEDEDEPAPPWSGLNQ
ncbi:MAG: hypothetical protein JXQ75_11065 [Phycisphaerae bacterium]|nr:hypothetical protein [Phycisphaerae bacterium]